MLDWIMSFFRKQRPYCFGQFRSPQWDAEGDCGECEFERGCYEKLKDK